MRILELSLSGTIGSVEMGPVSTIICQLSNQFSLNDNEVTIADPMTTLSRDLLNDAVGLVEITAHAGATLHNESGGSVGKLVNFLNSWYQTLLYLRCVSKQIDLKDFEVIHVHDPRLAFLVTLFHRKKCVYTSHSPHWCIRKNEQKQCDSGTTVFGKIIRKINIMVEVAAIRRSAYTIALGNYLQDCIPEAPIETIPSGLNMVEWQPIEKIIARNALGYDIDDFIVVFVGRIAPVKGPDILLDAIKILTPHIHQLRVEFIGSFSGSFNVREHQTTYAKKLITESSELPAHFLGFINNRSEEFKQHVCAADVFVVPSLVEPQGLVVLEALAMGKPVIASSTGGIPTMLTDEVGRLFPPGNALILADHLKELYDNPETLELMQNSCRTHIENNFTWKKVANHYMQTFAKICATQDVLPSY